MAKPTKYKFIVHFVDTYNNVRINLYPNIYLFKEIIRDNILCTKLELEACEIPICKRKTQEIRMPCQIFYTIIYLNGHSIHVYVYIFKH